MRRAAKIDDNQRAIVEVLRRLGFSVQSLASVGDGVPDLLVGRAGRNILLEVKNSNLPPNKQRLTEREEAWQRNWRGQCATVKSQREAVETCFACLLPPKEGGAE